MLVNKKLIGIDSETGDYNNNTAYTKEKTASSAIKLMVHDVTGKYRVIDMYI